MSELEAGLFVLAVLLAVYAWLAHRRIDWLAEHVEMRRVRETITMRERAERAEALARQLGDALEGTGDVAAALAAYRAAIGEGTDD